KIQIIESLSEKDRKTGQILIEDIKMMELSHRKGVAIDYVSITTKEELFTHIDTLIHEAKYNRVFPVLQLDVHGTSDKSGIVLNSGETIIWRQLCDKLRELNSLSKGNLIIVMAACYGANIQQGIDIFNRSPFWGVMSPLNTVTPDEILESLSEFYRHIFENSSDVNNLPIYTALKLITTDAAFLQYWKVYLDDKSPDDLLTQHVVKFYAEVKKINPDIKFDDLRKTWAIECRSKLLEKLKHFLFADVDPYNLDKVKFTSSNEILEHFKDEALYGY
ncbi:hypothetical protein CXF86_01780, partial [Shewanella sp. GutCb]|uniref:hypothetical protein n=1 Tax=Shewanella sp. GutCb TaxID=2058315 RepID=UPI000CBAB737